MHSSQHSSKDSHLTTEMSIAMDEQQEFNLDQHNDDHIKMNNISNENQERISMHSHKNPFTVNSDERKQVIEANKLLKGKCSCSWKDLAMIINPDQNEPLLELDVVNSE
jgi:hypothetical protein